MELEDYAERDSFTAAEMEHILQLPMIDVVELLAKIPRAGSACPANQGFPGREATRAPGGRFQGEACRALVKRLARGRLFADLIARQAVNAEPEIRRGPESENKDRFLLLNASSVEEFTVRFSGDLRNYLNALAPPTPDPAEEAGSSEPHDNDGEVD